MEQVLLVLLSFGLGYALGSLDNLRKALKGPVEEQSNSFVSGVINSQRDQKTQVRKKVTIDETKYVTDISTEALELKGSSLGVVTQTSDNITTAANKLAQLKKMKG
jgi:hypothetical protein